MVSRTLSEHKIVKLLQRAVVACMAGQAGADTICAICDVCAVCSTQKKLDTKCSGYTYGSTYVVVVGSV